MLNKKNILFSLLTFLISVMIVLLFIWLTVLIETKVAKNSFRNVNNKIINNVFVKYFFIEDDFKGFTEVIYPEVERGGVLKLLWILTIQ